MTYKKYGVIIDSNHPNPPNKRETEAADIVAKHFRTVIQFMVPINSYKTPTPDVAIFGRLIEIKTSEGKSRRLIDTQFRKANKQLAEGIILDGRYTKLEDKFLLKEINKNILTWHRIRFVYFIDKNEKVFEITKKTAR